MKKDESAPLGAGGCYEVGRDGVRRMVSPGTAEADYGGGPRTADGKRIVDTIETARPAAEAPATSSRPPTVAPE